MNKITQEITVRKIRGGKDSLWWATHKSCMVIGASRTAEGAIRDFRRQARRQQIALIVESVKSTK